MSGTSQFPTMLDAFNAKYVPVTESGCWIWLGQCTVGGYGVLRYCQQSQFAHRFSYEQKHGSIPDGLTIDHLCRVTQCCNPDHLEAVTLRENILRGTSPSANHARKTHCIRGHLLPEPAIIASTRKPVRRCEICWKATHDKAWRKYEEKRRKKQPC